jgi:hypothetical protein
MLRSVNYFSLQSTLAQYEVAKARPLRGKGASEQTSSHLDSVLALLREGGPTGVPSSELYDVRSLYGRSPRNRISEMRKDGYLIKTIHTCASAFRYVPVRENTSHVEGPPAKPAPAWQDCSRVTPAPLFGLWRQR